ncbi:MAG: sulfite exporter TauE/SafE family protein [Desulfobulbus sp.]|jgi:uncharacterized membrane protein YfcA
MLFETAGIQVYPLLPPLVAFAISFFCSMGGVSGAFLLLPFQMTCLGYTNPSVSATNQLFNIVAIPSGVYRYWKEGRMVWPLTLIVIVGTLPGVLIGAIVRVIYLPDPRNFKLFAAAVLLYLGGKMVLGLVKKNKQAGTVSSGEQRFQEIIRQRALGKWDKSKQSVQVTRFNLKRLGYTFYDDSFDVSVSGLFMLSFIVGIIGGIYGIGGGAILSPFFVTVFKLPVYTVAGATLMATFVTSVAGVVFYQSLSWFFPNVPVSPDWILGILFGIGGIFGMYLGARCQKFIPAKIIKWMLAVIVLFIAIKYIIEFFN